MEASTVMGGRDEGGGRRKGGRNTRWGDGEEDDMGGRRIRWRSDMYEMG
jgi:hypothetical protein